MTPRVARTPRARLDLVELALYMEETRGGSAERFLDADEAAFGRIADFPHIGSEVDPDER